MRVEPPRAITMPITRISIPVAMLWLTMYDAAPTCACEEKAKMPSAMNPKWAIDTYATKRFRSACPNACNEPYST